MKIAKIFYLLFTFVPFYSFASSFVQINEKNKLITIQTNLYFYGKQNISNESLTATQEIKSLWKNSNLIFPKNSKYPDYKLLIQLNTQPITEIKALDLANSNSEAQNNFIRLDTSNSAKESFILSDGANSGIWYMAQGIGKTKTAAHEFGHILGLSHLNPNVLKETDKISIMATRMTDVDIKFQNTGAESIYGFKNKLNISFRIVTSNDLNNLSQIIFKQQSLKKSNKFEMGKTANFIFDQNGLPL